MFHPANTKVGRRGCAEASFFVPLHQRALDAAVGNEPQEGGEHIPAAGDPRTHERERNGEGKLSLLFFASGETAADG